MLFVLKTQVGSLIERSILVNEKRKQKAKWVKGNNPFNEFGTLVPCCELFARLVGCPMDRFEVLILKVGLVVWRTT